MLNRSVEYYYYYYYYYYCDVDGVSYATASKIQVTSNVIIATRRLQILRLIHAV
jgi:hypothetical protein